jgi:Rps23 Pro-64 3,4-dihydroxylase Tpa1-like proline 4-hydroxylase
MMPMFEGASAATAPFPHAAVPAILASADADAALAWLETDAPWQLRVASFYEQYEFSLTGLNIPSRVRGLTDPAFIEALRDFLRSTVGAVGDLELADICAHKLVPDQTIRVHNDFIGEEETHRILVQLNSGWAIENGGILMIFSSDRPEDVFSVVMPTHGSGFAFEISERSFHAVSTIKTGERYTLVYTFRADRA